MPAPRQTKVKVYLRTRPTENFANEMIDFGPDGKSINIYNKRRPVSQGYVNNQITDWSFKVDGIMHNVTQETLYDQVVKDITLNTLDGYNGTVLCYGQTGAGKTFTMTGATENYQQRGIIPRTIQHLFKEIQNRQDRSYTVRIGFIEIYNEQLIDLLGSMPLGNSHDSNLTIYDDRGDVFVKGLTYQIASNEEEALNLLFEGETNRSIGAHILNKESSRSHCIFTVRIESKSISSSNDKYTLSKLNLVDLAGSERLAKTQSQGITQKEAQYINKSLSFLEQAVIGLTDSKKPFVQFRQSKLTHILKDSIGGNCMTYMIANIWPEARHMEETVSTLRFANRMMNVTVEPAVNEIIDPMRMMQKLDNEVKMLRQELAMHDTLANRKNNAYEPLSEHQLYEIENQCRRFIEGSVDEIEIVNVRQIQAAFNSFKRICHLMERDVEAKLRERFALIDRNDVEQLAEAQKAGLNIDDSSYVGDTDGQGFGVGLASKDSRVNKQDLLKVTKKNRSKAAGKASSPQMDQKASTKSKEDQLQQKDSKKDLTKDSSSLAQKDSMRPTTPPPKNVAFEEFKAERGNEINRIWNENKDILANKRRQYSDLAHKINDTKTLIDRTRENLDFKRNEKINMGEFISEMGEPLIDEEEFGLIKRLQDLKTRYRDDFDRWRELKAEIVYCQNLVEQCRQRLIQEFDSWYNETYLNAGTLLKHNSSIPHELKSDSAVVRQYEDAVEKFERLQREIMSNDFDSIPYNTARLRNERRHMYNDALEKANHHYLTSNKQMGAPLRKLVNPPPGKLSVS